jgi:Bifunctional DNA primase/polymerase, N-terminal
MRFGSHARVIVGNGWRSVIPVRGKTPLVENWQTSGAPPPDDRRLKLWSTAYPNANIGLVVDGQTVAIDADIAPDRFPTPSIAGTTARALAGVADKILGKTPFIRIGLEPKWMRFYAAADVVPTIAGGPVEVFCTAGSKQVLIGGLHPDTGNEYRWTGKASPVTHSWALLPPVWAAQVTEFRSQAIQLCEMAGYKLTRRSRVQRPRGRPSISSLSSRSPHPITFNEGGVVSELLSELLTLMAQEPDRDRRKIAAEFFSRAEHGERHYHLVAAVSGLVLCGLGDAEIIDALKAAYAENVPDDPRMIGLIERPAWVRLGMAKRGAAVFPIADLDRTFGSDWSIFR